MQLRYAKMAISWLETSDDHHKDKKIKVREPERTQLQLNVG